jgi:hypothetical protein
MALIEKERLRQGLTVRDMGSSTPNSYWYAVNTSRDCRYTTVCDFAERVGYQIQMVKK